MPEQDLTGELAKAKSVADGLQFACRLPDRKPDFTACGGSAAEAYWEYFTPARVVSLVAALEAVLALTQSSDGKPRHPARILTVGDVREAITRALNGAGDDTGR